MNTKYVNFSTITLGCIHQFNTGVTVKKQCCMFLRWDLFLLHWLLLNTRTAAQSRPVFRERKDTW